MIIRCWQALAKADREAAYLAHFRAEVLPALRSLAGFHGATVLRRPRPDGIALTVLTRWESMAAVRAFAGENVESAVVAPAAQPCFHSYDPRVTHHEMVLDGRG